MSAKTYLLDLVKENKEFDSEDFTIPQPNLSNRTEYILQRAEALRDELDAMYAMEEAEVLTEAIEMLKNRLIFEEKP